MLKFALIITLSLMTTNTSLACDAYESRLLSEFSAACSEQNAIFQNACIPAQGNIVYGSASLYFADAGAGRSIVYCRYTACHTGQLYGHMGYAVTVPNDCTQVDPPAVAGPKINGNGPDTSLTSCGSVIENVNQVVGETIPLTGLPFFLSHFSSRTKGRIADYTSTVPLNGPTVASRVSSFSIEIREENNTLISSTNIASTPNLNFTYQWDGLENGVDTWGARNKKIIIKTNIKYGSPIVEKVYNLPFGNLKAKKLGLGGWLPSNWHFYDSVAKKVYNGDGTVREVEAQVEGEYNRVAAPNGQEIYYFDQLGRIVYTKTGLTGAIINSFAYRSDEKIASITDAFNKVTRFIYDDAGNLVEIISSENIKTKFSQDLNGFTSSITNPKNEVYRMTYKDTKGLLATFTKPNGNITTFTYDVNGKLVLDSNSAGHSATLLKTDTGVKLTSAMGRVKENFYNSDDKSETQINPSGLSAKYIFSKTEDVQILPYASFKTTYENDPRFGNQVKSVAKIESNDFGSTQTIIQNEVDLSNLTNPFAINSLSKTITEGNSEYNSHYDGLTRTRTVTSKLGRTIATQVDQLERPIWEKQGEFLPKKYIYTEDLITKISQGERFQRFQYDPQTKLLQSIKNAKNEKTSFAYDEAQRLKEKTLPDGRVIQYIYDSNGNLESLTPPGRPAHKQIYGANEKLAIYNPPLLRDVASVNTTYSYNLDKELIKITRPDGKEINYNYNQTTGLLDSISGSSGTFTKTYNQERLSKITDPSNQSIAFTYIGSVANSLTLKDQNQNTVYQYQRSPLADTNGLTQNEAIVAGGKTHSINYGYDDDKFLTLAGDLSLTYNSPNGKLKETNLGNIKEEYFYNNYGEVKGFRAFSIENNQNKLLYSYELKRDQLGSIIKKTESFGKDEEKRHHHRHFHFCRHHNDHQKIDTDYFYDQAGRLVRVRAEKRADSIYVYDKNSNRIAGVATGSPFLAIYDNQDRLIKFNNNVYTYNANGELLTKAERIKNSYATTNYNYDVFGGLKLAGNVTYQIDPLQRRSAKLINGVVVKKYAYNVDGQLIAELDSQGNLQKTFIYASRSHAPDYFIDQNNELFKLIVDHLGSTRLVVKASTGEIVQKMNHDEFGKVLEDSNPGLTPFGFAGGIYDSETKLVRFGVRDYDSETGRWLSKDPIRFDAHGTNLYGYVENNPSNLIDPSGEDYKICVRPIDGLPVLPHEYIKFDDGTTISWGPQAPISGPGHNTTNDSGGVCGNTNKSTNTQDQKMKEWAKFHEKDNYNILSNNCFDFVNGSINAGR